MCVMLNQVCRQGGEFLCFFNWVNNPDADSSFLCHYLDKTSNKMHKELRFCCVNYTSKIQQSAMQKDSSYYIQVSKVNLV